MRPFESKSHFASTCVGALLEMLTAGEFSEPNHYEGKLLLSGDAWLPADYYLRLEIAIPSATFCSSIAFSRRRCGLHFPTG